MVQELDQENDYVPVTYNRICVTQWVAQSFLAGKTGKCDKVKLYLYRAGIPNANLVIAIYSCIADLPVAELASQIFAPADVGTISGVKRTWLFSGVQADLVAGTKYCIVVKSSATYNVNNEYRWEVTVTNTGYANGTTSGSTNQGSSWTVVAYDESFQQYIYILPCPVILFF